ncbi:MAG: putative DNA modification/repair radical SAM protein [Chloroflexi bacterium]|nr:putative DNA modification/repair radical SAM protein [Chloroflexota bacterium]
MQRPDGKRLTVLKTMLSSFCARNCYYCPWRRGRDLPRTQFAPEELAAAFVQMHTRRLVEGLFLSSGVHGRSAWTMDRLIATTEILRRKHHFSGYVHLKIMPGADEASVEAAMQYADRISINLEAPTPERLARLAPEKNLYADLEPTLYWANQINARRRARGLKAVSTTTQFVVGATGETDREIVGTVGRLAREARLSRAYYSAFHPVADTPLDGLPAEDPRREHRLYQADFLMRQYGFAAGELEFDEAGNLPRHTDPKLMHALRHPERFPLEINRATRDELLRVPGIGPLSADRILQLRRAGALRDIRALERIGMATRRAAPFILLNGRRPTQQLPLF